MRKLRVLLFSFLVLLSMTISVEAFDSKTVQRNNGESASAFWTEINGDLTTDTMLFVTETEDGTDVYLSINTWGPDKWYSKSGYLFTKDDIFKLDKKLNSASLSEVTINIEDYNTDTGQIEPIKIKADWVGIGDTSTSSSIFRSKTGDFIAKTSDSSINRQASVQGSINNCDLGTDGYGALSKFKSALLLIERERTDD